MTECVSALIANCIMRKSRFPFCAVTERLPASRSRAVGAYEFRRARASGGRFLLRIEDIDATRCRPEYETAIYEDLAWLGIAWEEPVRRQSHAHVRIRRSAGPAATGGTAVSGVRKPRGDRAASCRSARRRRRGRATRTARRSIRAMRSRVPIARAQALIDSGAPYALRLDMAAAQARSGFVTWHEEYAGYGGEPDQMHRPARAMGRRDPGAQGNANELSSVGGRSTTRCRA